MDRPWEGFELNIAAVIDYVNISHRAQHGVKGGLHEETNYWKEENGPHSGKFITRKYIDGKFTKNFAEHICDESIKKLVFERLIQYDYEPKKAFAETIYLKNKSGNPVPIRKVRVWKESNTMKKIKNNIWIEPGDNHHIEIFSLQHNEEKELVCKVWPTFDVAQRIRNKQSIILCKHPDKEFEHAKFLMSLSKGESVILNNKSGQEVIARITGISGNPEDARKIDIDLCEIQIGDITKLELQKKKKLRQQLRIQSFSDFAKRNVRKITVDPLGRIRWADKKYWCDD